MDDDTVEKDRERLDDLEKEIDTARQHLGEEKEKREHEERFYDEGGGGEGPVPG